MFYIKQLELLYCDIKNTANRSTAMDLIKEVEVYKAVTRDDAREIVLEILNQHGGVHALSPKILTNSSGSMYIECDHPIKTYNVQGSTDIKCLALEINYDKFAEENSMISSEMKTFEESLGPKFSL
jgi:hypothetical protein